MTLPVILDLLAVFVFALTGALVASRARLDLVGFMFLACLTGVGGGTLRDLLLDRTPIFWIENPYIIGISCAAGIFVFFFAHRLQSRYRAIRLLDAMALSVAVAAGVSIARDAGVSAPIVVIMGIATGTFGGLMRDVVANEIPLVLSKGELYISAALAGATTAVLTDALVGEPNAMSLLAASVVTFALRAGSIKFGWHMPTFRDRAPVTKPPLYTMADEQEVSDSEPGKRPDGS